MKQMVTAAPKDKVNEVFFQASSEAALKAYAKKGEVPVGLTALVQNGPDLELIPILFGTTPMDVSLILEGNDKALDPVIQYIADHPGSRVIVFFMSATGRGSLLFEDTGKLEDVETVINAARTEQSIGKTTCFSVTKDATGKVTFAPINASHSDKWMAEPNPTDLPSIAAQMVLDGIWKAYAIRISLSSLGHE